jgi:hypothetical protein
MTCIKLGNHAEAHINKKKLVMTKNAEKSIKEKKNVTDTQSLRSTHNA